MKLSSNIKIVLNELSNSLTLLDADSYIRSCRELSGSTIGQHTRHIIELFQCLISQYDNGTINYDSRLRNRIIEVNKETAVICIQEIISGISLPNKPLFLIGESGEFLSNFNRELLYNLEHCIHHQALIKVALLSFDADIVSENFGVAPSTIKFRKQCAQ